MAKVTAAAPSGSTRSTPNEPADPRFDSSEDAPFDADELYALSVLHDDGRASPQTLARRGESPST